MSDKGSSFDDRLEVFTEPLSKYVIPKPAKETRESSNNKLLIFIDCIRKGEVPSEEVMRYVAYGINDYLVKCGRSSHWPLSRSSLPKHTNSFIAYSLCESGISQERAAAIMGINNHDDGRDYMRNFREWINFAKKRQQEVCENVFMFNVGFYMNKVLGEYRDILTHDEIKNLETCSSLLIEKSKPSQ